MHSSLSQARVQKTCTPYLVASHRWVCRAVLGEPVGNKEVSFLKLQQHLLDSSGSQDPRHNLCGVTAKAQNRTALDSYCLH